MADREERVIGFQAVQCINRMVQCVLDVTSTLRGYSGESTVEDVQADVLRAIGFLNQELTKLTGFLGYYPQQAKIDNALNWLGVLRSQVDGDGANLWAVLDTLQRRLGSRNNMNKLRNLGNQILEAVEENVVEFADTAIHYTPDHMLIAGWDLAEACGYVLQGRCSATGADGLYTTVDAIRNKANKHLITFNRMVYAFESEPEAAALMSAMQVVESQLPAATTLAELSTLGQTLLGSIPSAPLIRRHWKYGN